MERTVSRVCGDTLDLRFSSKGALSRATLTVGESRYDASSSLPGLTAENCLCYLEELGFRENWIGREKGIAKVFEPIVFSLGLFIESAVCTPSGGVEVTVAGCRQRVFPPLAFRFLVTPAGELVFTSVPDAAVAQRFLRSVCSLPF